MMKGSFKIVIVLMLFITGMFIFFLKGTFAEEQNSWFNSSWMYRQPINISNTAGNLTNYQVRLDLNSSNVGSHFNWSNNGDDIRFTNSTDDLLYFWIEYWNATEEKAIIWVNVTYLLNNTNTTIYMYYGNPVADSISDINSTFISVINNLSLKASWHFDENAGNIVYDTSGNNNDGTIHGATWTTNGKFGKALEFDGVDDYVSVPDSSSLDITDEITIEAWINSNILGSARGIVFKNQAWMVREESDGRFQVFVYVDGRWRGLTTTEKYTPGKWCHIVMTYDSNTRKLAAYVNGVSKSRTLSSLNSYTINPSGANTFIGTDISYGDKYFNGTIDEVRIYNRALTPEEISDLYNNYGYTTTNYFGRVLVRKKVNPEPSVSKLGNEEKPIKLQIVSTEPENKTILYEPTLNFKVNVTWDNADETNCSLYLNGVKKNTEVNCTKGINTIKPTNYDYIIYNWFIKCNSIYGASREENQSSTKIVAIAESAEGLKVTLNKIYNQTIETYNQTKKIYTFNVNNIMNPSFVLWLVLLCAGTFTIFLGISRRRISFLIISTILYMVSAFYSFNFTDIIGEAGVWVMIGLSLIGLVVSFVYTLYATVNITKKEGQNIEEEW